MLAAIRIRSMFWSRTRPVAVDTGFIVYNELNYPNLTALFDSPGVETQASEMSFAASLGDGDLEYSGSSLLGLFGQPRNLLRPRFWRMLRDILRFYREGPQLLANSATATALSLGAISTGKATPTPSSTITCCRWPRRSGPTGTAGMRAHPATAFVRFCLNHGLMRVQRAAAMADGRRRQPRLCPAPDRLVQRPHHDQRSGHGRDADAGRGAGEGRQRRQRPGSTRW